MEKNYLLALFSSTMLLASCNDALEVEKLSLDFGKGAQVNVVTKTLNVDSLETGNIIQLAETEELKALKEKLEKIKMQRANVFAYNDYDEYFSTNIYAIRELALTISARGVVGNTSNRYLSCDGKSKEVVLASSASSDKQRFFIKIYPVSSGIPYLIYSSEAVTPLAVGQYDSSPNNKVLFAQSDNSGYLYGASWDLIPSQTRGYFAIESQSYLGLSDPNSPWSVFNYVVEVKNNNKIGYGQYTKKAYQEFQIAPVGRFEVREVIFNANSAVITKAADIQIKSTARNTSIEPKLYTIPINKDYYETSYFSENTSSIKFDKYSLPFQRPTVQANRIVLPEEATPYDAEYVASNTQNIIKNLAFDIKGEAPENCLIEVTSLITTYNVSINYTAKAYHGVREVMFSGTWRGYVIADPKLTKPNHITRYFDLDTGEEIFYFSRSKKQINN